MEFDPDAADALEALYRDGPEVLVDRIEQTLDQLERDPMQAAMRRHRFQHSPTIWAVPVRIHSYDYVILCGLDGETVVVRYVGPLTF